MEKRKFVVVLVTMLIGVFAGATICTAGGPKRTQESFTLGDSGCQMNLIFSSPVNDSGEIAYAVISPAQQTCVEPCWECEQRCPDDFLYLCADDPNSEGCKHVCCSTPPPAPGNGTGTSPACDLEIISPRPISDLLSCENCTQINGTYSCDFTSNNCEPLRYVERNIMEKSGDGSRYCYTDTTGQQVCRTF